MSQQALLEEGDMRVPCRRDGCSQAARAWLSCWAHTQGQQGRWSHAPPWQPLKAGSLGLLPGQE